MKNCPQCGQPRAGDLFKCPECDVFYSSLDEILFDDQEKRLRQTLSWQFKQALHSDHPLEAVRELMHTGWRQLPLMSKIAYWTIVAFVFVVVAGVLTF